MPSPLLQSVNRQNLEPGMNCFQQSGTTKPGKTLNYGATDKNEIIIIFKKKRKNQNQKKVELGVATWLQVYSRLPQIISTTVADSSDKNR